MAGELLERLDLDALLLFGASSEARMGQADIYWLSNFAGMRENYLLFPRRGDPVLFVQSHNHVPQARQLSVLPVEPGGPGGTWPDVGDRVGERLRQCRFGRIGLVGLLPNLVLERLTAAVPAATFTDVTRAYRVMRVSKSAEELEWIARGAQWTDAAHRALAEQARPGMLEHELMELVLTAFPAALGEAQVAFLGSTSMGDPDRCVPAQFPTDRRVESGDLFFTELSIAFGCYGGQSLRTFTLGEPSPEVARMHQLALQLFDATCRALRPGVSLDQVLATSDLAREAGYGMVDALAHGWCIGVLPPVVRSRAQPWAPTGNEWVFEAGQTIVVQPNVTTSDERLGVQVGDLCLVTDSGAKPLHGFRRELIVIE